MAAKKGFLLGTYLANRRTRLLIFIFDLIVIKKLPSCALGAAMIATVGITDPTTIIPMDTTHGKSKSQSNKLFIYCLSRYSRPRKHYYYSSSRYSRNNWNRGKRAAEAEVGFSDLESLRRMKRDIEARGLDMETWYRDMTEMDQDSCSKKLICELRAKQNTGGLTVR